jgi:hypothetical protein
MAEELVKAKTGVLAPAPAFMDEDAGLGTEQLASKMRPSYLKLVQKQSSEEIQARFGIGAFALVPENVLVWSPGEAPLRIVPIFHFSEYTKVASYLLKDSEPMIVDRSQDPRSDIARRANDPNLWSESHPQHLNDSRYDYRYVHSLVFLCCFQDESLRSPLPFSLVFNKGSFGTGQAFAGKIVMRKNRPLFGCVFDLSVDPQLKKNAKGEWRVPLVENPVEDPWVTDAQEYAEYKEMHKRFSELHAAGQIEIDDDASQDEEEVDGTY